MKELDLDRVVNEIKEYLTSMRLSQNIDVEDILISINNKINEFGFHMVYHNARPGDVECEDIHEELLGHDLCVFKVIDSNGEYTGIHFRLFLPQNKALN